MVAKGSKMSEESKEKMRQAKLGKDPWNKGIVTGQVPWITGKSHSEDSKEKMRLAKLGKPGNHRKPHSEETRAKISASKSGSVPWNKGIKMPVSFSETMSRVQLNKTLAPNHREKISKSLEGREHTYEHTMKVLESNIGGFWYGNIRYDTKPIYCERWKDVNPRVHAFFNYRCVECGIPENGRSHIGHHVFYVKKACCWYNEDGVYYSNLNAPDHKEHDYLIGENPNYFVILCSKCHGKTNGNFANRQKWADHFRELIDTKFNGRCYLTPEEFEDYKRSMGQ